MRKRTILLVLPLALCQACSTLYWTDGGPPGAIGWTDSAKNASETIVEGTVDSKGRCKTHPCFPLRLVYDPTGDRMIWSDLPGHVILAVDRKTGQTLDWKLRLGGAAIPGDICLDAARKSLYFAVTHLTSPRTYSVQSVALEDPKSVKVLIPPQRDQITTLNFNLDRDELIVSVRSTNHSPHSFWNYAFDTGVFRSFTNEIPETAEMVDCVLSRNGKMVYWTRKSGHSAWNGIWGAPLDGSGVPVHLVSQQVSYPFEIDIKKGAFPGKRLYWADLNMGWLASIELDSSGLESSDFRIEAKLRETGHARYPTALEWVNRAPQSGLLPGLFGIRATRVGNEFGDLGK